MTEREKNILCKKLGDNIKSARQQADITQVEFAKLLDLSRPSIVNIENGRQLPPLTIIFDIALVLNVDLEEILKNLFVVKKDPELEESSKRIIESWKNSTLDEHSEGTITTVEDFIKDTYQIPNE